MLHKLRLEEYDFSCYWVLKTVGRNYSVPAYLLMLLECFGGPIIVMLYASYRGWFLVSGLCFCLDLVPHRPRFMPRSPKPALKKKTPLG